MSFLSKNMENTRRNRFSSRIEIRKKEFLALFAYRIALLFFPFLVKLPQQFEPYTSANTATS